MRCGVSFTNINEGEKQFWSHVGHGEDRERFAT